MGKEPPFTSTKRDRGSSHAIFTSVVGCSRDLNVKEKGAPHLLMPSRGEDRAYWHQIAPSPPPPPQCSAHTPRTHSSLSAARHKSVAFCPLPPNVWLGVPSLASAQSFAYKGSKPWGPARMTKKGP